MGLTIAVIVCAYNEGRLLSGCLHSLRAQTRPPDEILVIDNASTDETGAVARAVPGVRLIDEPCKGLVDVIAITDHILMKRDLFARAARLATLGRRQFSVTEGRFQSYLEDIASEAKRAKRLYDLLVVPGAEITPNHIRSKMSSHIIALNIREFISADQPAEDILRAIRTQGAFSIACHPHHRTTRRVEVGTCYLWDHRKRLVDLVDVWEAANRDDLFSVTSLKHSRMSRTATSTRPNTSTRGRRCCAVTRRGKPSPGHCDRTWTWR